MAGYAVLQIRAVSVTLERIARTQWEAAPAAYWEYRKAQMLSSKPWRKDDADWWERREKDVLSEMSSDVVWEQYREDMAEKALEGRVAKYGDTIGHMRLGRWLASIDDYSLAIVKLVALWFGPAFFLLCAFLFARLRP